MASNVQEQDFSYCCEICGLEGLSEEEFRTHTQKAHVDGNAVCPFCELSAVSPPELVLHVNQAHLDFLTPETEHNISFIDDPSPSEYNGINEESCENNHYNFPSYSNSNQNQLDVRSGVNNINLSPKVNGGGALSPVNSRHGGQGSPLRSNLDLKLKGAAASASQNKLQCPMCNYTSLSPSQLEEHVNRSHFDLTSPSLGVNTNGSFSCPLCVKSFKSAPDLELHVNIEHRDILSPASPSTQSCPICGITFDNTYSNESAARHVDSHFPGACGGGAVGGAAGGSSDHRAALRERERREFEQLRAQYGMDDQGNFREQSVHNMQRAVFAGEMSVTDYYERTLDLREAESSGVDDGSSVTRSIGSEQLECKLVNTRKWIGATEVVTLLSFLRIKCQLVDFHRPTGAGGTHPELFNWVLQYFESSVGGEFTPPLYLQHQGHSRTIMGIEVHRDGSLILLVLDPSHSPQQMAQMGDANSTATAFRLLRKSEAAMKARQYQIVAVVGTIDSEQQYQHSKILRGLRIPQERLELVCNKQSRMNMSERSRSS
nr:unnamed protein product [Callosobruchus analis]